MLLVPFFWDTSNTEWFKLGIFLTSGGREGWTIEDGQKDKQVLKMLTDNDFPVVKLEKKSDVLYARVDSAKLNISLFYTWEEVDPISSEEDVWRTFLIPRALWTCPVFKENFLKFSELPISTDFIESI